MFKNNKKLITFAAGAVISVVVYIIAVNTVLSRIGSLRQQINLAETSMVDLRERLDVLNKVDKNLILSSLQDVSTALPANDSGALIVSSLRMAAREHNMILDRMNVSSGNVITTGLSTIGLEFEAVGTKDDAFAFVGDLSMLLPISNIGNLEIDTLGQQQNSGMVNMKVSMQSYWAGLPATISSPNSPVTQFDEGENSLLARLKDFHKPDVEDSTGKPGSVVTPSDRQDPFIVGSQ